MNTQEIKSLEAEWDQLIRMTFRSVSATYVTADGCGLIVNSKNKRDLQKISELLTRVGMEEAEILDPSPFLNCHALYMRKAAA